MNLLLKYFVIELKGKNYFWILPFHLFLPLVLSAIHNFQLKLMWLLLLWPQTASGVSTLPDQHLPPLSLGPYITLIMIGHVHPHIGVSKQPNILLSDNLTLYCD